ncbi:MAG: site-specific DNA-methyltransferase [Candidatus Eremiobacteraeota bacterium]|nr:site-specific DNA-methyltransferase [Candidatus Eremiobacteraeota bacterium]
MNRHRVIFGDSTGMPELEEESVHLMVTSPPYWCIKDYSHDSQTGFNQNYKEYMEDISKVLRETFRVLKPGCRAVVNIGDQYLRAKDFGRYRVQPIPADIIVKAREIGFDFMGNIIWKKISTTKTSGGGAWMGSIYHPKDGHITYEHEYIIILKKPGDWPRPTKKQKELSKLTKEERSSWFRGIWEIHPERQNEHIAMFPIEIPLRIIKMYSFHGETVLDPFLGSGTTLKAARMLGRIGTGYEINRTYREIIEKKLETEDLDLVENGDISFEYRK